MLKADELEISYGSTEALRGVTFEGSRKEIRSLLGPNGAGKSTAFNLLAGLDRPRAGKIYLDERDITSLSINQRAKLGLSYLLQKPSLFREMDVKRNLLVMLDNQKEPENRDKVAEKLLEKMGIEDLARKKSKELSAGQQRKAEIARSLATFPTFLLLDEPFSGLDPLSVEELKNIIIELKEEDGLGIMITDHKIRDTLEIANYNYLLKEGKIISEGSREELLSDPQARSTYLGEDFNLNRN